eukprot:TRINITY_DN538_c2_g1_i2.p1 TRINITY_DN538_c2_g1~~TRINITY_DN538_c2_g1_i2.p1  ORF type:complete len:317 (+),score=72.24 TRINITY_DN538_c2_g1_i2:66-953(+)
MKFACLFAMTVGASALFEVEKIRTCSTDQDCRQNGDTDATCTLSTGFCKCTSTTSLQIKPTGGKTFKSCFRGTTETQVWEDHNEKEFQFHVAMTFVEGKCDEIETYRTLFRTELETFIDQNKIVAIHHHCAPKGEGANIVLELKLPVEEIYRDYILNIVGDIVTRVQNRGTLLASLGNIVINKQMYVSTASFNICPQSNHVGTFNLAYFNAEECRALGCSKNYKLTNGACVVDPIMWEDADDELSTGAMTGIIIGTICSAIIIAGIIYYFFCWGHDNEEVAEQEPIKAENSAPDV